ncbi:hypothetical protein C1O63_1563 [Dehalococcoides mccartyi]|jgi:hypothetical protein|uniref:hypothetical protein n=1 Tax=Dehalococcoides mccartyi TaxID=61435 RepID=UPI0002B76C54|nr:hypothetical protein [Dehalococcoides mccartyi]AGG07376.1 hypothetical protein btf_267 [Dehalococcoides mccartyi BTF08]AQW61796.1 hypothetical protein B1779_00450 [Dehalococcoides mccartyi]POZ58414.1 hypothetical protein C1O63_1563 [Dehalococcoides mccartyi]
MTGAFLETEYDDLRKLAKKLHILLPEAFWEFEVRDKNGLTLARHRQRSHSWVRNAYNLMVCQAAAVPGDLAVGLAVVDINGTARSDATTQPASGLSSGGASNSSIYVNLGNGIYAGAGVDLFGIVVGTGNNPESLESYALATKIVSGNLAGQLSYSATDPPTISTIGTTKTVAWVRYFNNNSGGDITVNEAGVYTKGTYDNSSATFMLCRDLLAGGVVVPNTGQLKVTYTLQLTYPA